MRAAALEVTVMGPANAARADLQRLALRKLQARLAAGQSLIRPYILRPTQAGCPRLAFCGPIC